MADITIPPETITNIKNFVILLKTSPAVLEKPELAFLKDYLLSLGAKLPTSKPNAGSPPAGGDSKPAPTSPPPAAAADVELEEEEEEPLEPYPDLDMDGVVEADPVNLEQEMGNSDADVTEEAMDKSNEYKSEAVHLFQDGKYEECIAKYTDAIKLNGGSALLFGKRGQAFLKLNKPNACIKDCNRALQINPDSAISYKFRGRAHRLLGHWIEAANDLRQACKIDFDEQADEWLKEVNPNARKVEEWQVRKKRHDEEKELKQRKRRAQERARAQAEARKAQAEFEAHQADGDDDDGMPGGFGGGGGGGGGFPIPGLDKLMSDPEVLELFSDPEVTAAFADISQNPMNILKYQSNPKVAKLMKIMQSKMGGGMGGMGGMGGGMPFGGMGGGGMPGGFPGGMGGMPGGFDFGGAGPGADAGGPPPSAPPKGPNVTDDLD